MAGIGHGKPCLTTDFANRAKGKLPDDAFTFIAFVDAYNLKDAGAYRGQGLSWQMIVHRNALEQFVADLEEEYRVFKESFGVDQYDEDE